MCGIAAILQHAHSTALDGQPDQGCDINTLMQWLGYRGPDSHGIVQCLHTDAPDDIITKCAPPSVTLAASLLHLQGPAPPSVPLALNGDVLCYNGTWLASFNCSH